MSTQKEKKEKDSIFLRYVKNTRRTWNSNPDKVANDTHAFLGVVTEIGELCDDYKKVIGYGEKDLDTNNVLVEIGDVSYYIARIIDQILLDVDANAELAELLMTDIDKVFTEEVEDNDIKAIGLVLSLPTYYRHIYTGFIEKNVSDFLTGLITTISNLNQLSIKLGTTYEKVLDANIEKLKKRFPEKFDAELAKDENRDTDAEEKAVVSKTK